MIKESLTISPRFCGPSQSGNGGYVCGLIARHIRGPATVRLMVPPPVGSELHIDVADGVVTLRSGDTLVGEGRSATLDLTPPAAPSFAEAVDASRSYLGFTQHSFPRCFVCGPQRQAGDGMRIFAGPVKDSPLVAAPWVADASLARDGRIADEFLWAALDCPSGFAILPVPTGKSIVLGQLTARIDGSVRAGEPCVVAGWANGIEGRKRSAGSALYDASGNAVAIARATWIEIPAGTFPAED